LFNFKTAIVLLILLLSGNGLLQAAPTLASVIKAEESDGKPPVLVNGGLLGALGAGMDEVQSRLGLSMQLLDTWRLRSEEAVDEVGELVEQSSAHPSWNGVGDFFLLSAIWLGAFFGLMLSVGLLARYLTETRLVRTRPRIQALVGYMVQYLLPAVVTLVLTLYASRFLQDTVGRSLGIRRRRVTGALGRYGRSL